MYSEEKKMTIEEVSHLRVHGVASRVSSSGAYPETKSARVGNSTACTKHSLGIDKTSTLKVVIRQEFKDCEVIGDLSMFHKASRYITSSIHLQDFTDMD